MSGVVLDCIDSCFFFTFLTFIKPIHHQLGPVTSVAVRFWAVFSLFIVASTVCGDFVLKLGPFLLGST